MKKPMTTYKIEKTAIEKHSFVQTRRGGMAYAENGTVKTYSNKAQAQKRVNELNALGYNVSYSLAWPFVIVPVTE
jgi:hypothetical protein